MQITHTLPPGPRSAWRAWLEAHHASAPEIWVLFTRGVVPAGEKTYLDVVEEALCFGWIDGIAKVAGEHRAQRVTPRRPRGNWTELNKERARRLIAAGRMTDAGRRVLPDLDPAAFVVPAPIEARMRAEGVWDTFTGFPPLYQRVRVGNVAEVLRDPVEYERRLGTLLAKTRLGVLYGNWDDRDMPRTDG